MLHKVSDMQPRFGKIKKSFKFNNGKHISVFLHSVTFLGCFSFVACFLRLLLSVLVELLFLWNILYYFCASPHHIPVSGQQLKVRVVKSKILFTLSVSPY